MKKKKGHSNNIGQPTVTLVDLITQKQMAALTPMLKEFVRTNELLGFWACSAKEDTELERPIRLLIGRLLEHYHSDEIKYVRIALLLHPLTLHLHFHPSSSSSSSIPHRHRRRHYYHHHHCLLRRHPQSRTQGGAKRRLQLQEPAAAGARHALRRVPQRVLHVHVEIPLPQLRYVYHYSSSSCLHHHYASSSPSSSSSSPAHRLSTTRLGLVYCASCTPHTAILQDRGHSSAPVRLCDNCHHALTTAAAAARRPQSALASSSSSVPTSASSSTSSLPPLSSSSSSVPARSRSSSSRTS